MLLTRKTQRYVWLTITGYVFYGFWNYKFCFLMLFSTLVSYFAGLGFLRWNDDARMRKLCLVVPVTADLLLLGFFKYFNFTLDTLGLFSSWLGIDARPPHLDIILPVGISFYTFHTISYIVDSYRGTVTPTRNFFEFALLRVAVFATGGRSNRAVPPDRARSGGHRTSDTTTKDLSWRGRSSCIGLIKKVLIADSLARNHQPGAEELASLSTARRLAVRCWDTPISSISISPATATWPWGSGYLFDHAHSAELQFAVQGGRHPLISGGAGTSRYRAACATISTFRSAGTNTARPWPIGI